jgi:hypothetical protein
MMRRRWAGILALGLLAVFRASASADDSAGPHPRLAIENPIWEAGEIEPGALVSHEFVIKNEGAAPLEIVEVKPGCGCSTAMFDRVVAPGETGRISFAVRVYREWAGQYLRKTAWVLTNDPLSPQVRLVVDGRIRPLPADGADSALAPEKTPPPADSTDAPEEAPPSPAPAGQESAFAPE